MADSNKAAAKAAKQEQRQAKRAKRKQTWSQLWQAFNLQRKEDNKLIPLMLIAVLGMGLLFFLLGLLFDAQWYLLILGLILGATLAMWIFSRRLQNNMYDKAADSPGAAGWTLENMRNSFGIVWFTKTAAAMTPQMDVVHRVVGNPGIVLVGEGNRHRVERLMAEQKKRFNRIVAGVPVYEIFIGEGEDEVRLRDLQRKMLKLARNYRKDDVYPINARIEALDNTLPAQGLPKGPIPKGARVSGMNRRARRTAERNKKG